MTAGVGDSHIHAAVVVEIFGDDEWVRLMIENPILIERPIVITSKKAAIGRPPEKILDLIK